MSGLKISFGDAGQVASLEAIPYALPFKNPYVTARGTLHRREAVLVVVRTSEGLVGLGEAVPLSLRSGDPITGVHAELQRIGDWLKKSAGHPKAAAVLAELVKDSAPPTRCAVLTAWLDLAGKAEGVPAWKLLGGTKAEPVLCNATLVGGRPLQGGENALGLGGGGVETVKVKVGGRGG